jgi:uncharacterized membrane protein (UPF0182 family)
MGQVKSSASYLAASGEHGFPSLAKVIVAMNRHTAMANSLALAFDQLQQRAINTPPEVALMMSFYDIERGIIMILGRQYPIYNN